MSVNTLGNYMLMVYGPGMSHPELTEVIRRNMLRLRTERGWSQRHLSVLMRGQGIRQWTPNAVAQIEGGRQRADRIADVAALCAVFAITVTELLECNERVVLDGGEQVSVATLVSALDGRLTPPEIADLGALDTLDRYDAERKAAHVLGLDQMEFHDLCHEVFILPGGISFTEYRDRHAGITEDMADSSVRARRGHATRELLMQMKQVLDRDGIDAISARYWDRVQATVQRADDRRRQERIDAYETLTGTVWDPADFDPDVEQ